MVQRLLVNASTVKISKAGFDVTTAAEKNLLLSLSARNNQVIQSGTKSPDSVSGSVVTYNITFPTQQSVPDFIVEVGGATVSYDFVNGMATFEATPSTSGLTVVVTGAGSGAKLAYCIFRKIFGN